MPRKFAGRRTLVGGLRRRGAVGRNDAAGIEVKNAAHWIAPQPGGRGAVRALAEFILQAKGVAYAEMTQG